MEQVAAADGPQMRTGRLFPLHAFEVAMRDDPDVRGVLYTGSLGSGTADRFSDLDIELWVTDAAYARARVKLREVLGLLGDVRFSYYFRNSATMTGFVGETWQPVDLSLRTPTELQPSAAYARARVVKDTNDLLTHVVAQSPRTPATATWEQARATIEEAIDIQIYLALHNARGDAWTAIGEASRQCGELYTLLARLRGRESFGFRYVDHLLSSPERAVLTQAWPAAPTREEVRRAARGLWAWTTHVWREAETVLGRSLEVSIDETELLAAVERIYQQETN